MKFKNKDNECVETADGRTVYLSRSVAAAVHIGIKNIETGNKRYVVLRRGEDMTHEDKLCFPCGYVDWNETVLEAAIREVYEETSINILNTADLKLSYIDDDPTKFRENITFHYDLKLEMTTQMIKNLISQLTTYANKIVNDGEVKEILLVDVASQYEDMYAFDHLTDMQNLDKTW